MRAVHAECQARCRLDQERFVNPVGNTPVTILIRDAEPLFFHTGGGCHVLLALETRFQVFHHHGSATPYVGLNRNVNLSPFESCLVPMLMRG